MNVWGIVWLFVSIVQSNHIHLPNNPVLLAIEFSFRGWTPFLSPLTADSKRQCTLIGLVKIFVSCVDFQIKFKTNLLPCKVNRPLVHSQSLFCSLFLSGWKDNYWFGFKWSRHIVRFICWNKHAPVQLTGNHHKAPSFITKAFSHGSLIGACRQINGTDEHLCHQLYLS